MILFPIPLSFGTTLTSMSVFMMGNITHITKYTDLKGYCLVDILSPVPPFVMHGRLILASTSIESSE